MAGYKCICGKSSNGEDFFRYESVKNGKAITVYMCPRCATDENRKEVKKEIYLSNKHFVSPVASQLSN